MARRSLSRGRVEKNLLVRGEEREGDENVGTTAFPPRKSSTRRGKKGQHIFAASSSIEETNPRA